MITKLQAAYMPAAAASVHAAGAHAAIVDAARAPPDCQAHAGFDRDLTLPGYLLPTRLGPATCIPITVTAQHPPAKYKGDFYVDEFTDQKLRQRWSECKRDPACFERVNKIVLARRPPNKGPGYGAHGCVCACRGTGSAFSAGRADVVQHQRAGCYRLRRLGTFFST